MFFVKEATDGSRSVRSRSAHASGSGAVATDAPGTQKPPDTHRDESGSRTGTWAGSARVVRRAANDFLLCPDRTRK